MAERMSDEANNNALAKIQKLIEDELGCKVEPVIWKTGNVRRLDLGGLLDVGVKLEDEIKGERWYRKLTGETRVIVSNNEFRQGLKFKKWTLLSNLDFGKGIAHRKTAQFLGKVNELVELETAKQVHQDDKANKRVNDVETLTTWLNQPGMLIGYRLVDRAAYGFFLVMDGMPEGSVNKMRVAIRVDSSPSDGDRHWITGIIDGYEVSDNRLKTALRMYKELHSYLCPSIKVTKLNAVDEAE